MKGTLLRFQKCKQGSTNLLKGKNFRCGFVNANIYTNHILELFLEAIKNLGNRTQSICIDISRNAHASLT